MANLLLISNANDTLWYHLQSSGFPVRRYCPPLSPADAGALPASRDAIVLLELSDEQINDPLFTGDILKNIGGMSRVLCISGPVPEGTKKILLGHGVSEMISSGDPRRIISYIRTVSVPADISSGKIAVYEKSPVVTKVLDTIIRQFGYEPVFLENLGDLEISAAGYQMLLLNIEFDRLLINNLIKKSITDGDFKKLPVISYKDMSRGLFVHEIVSGLNRITKMILSLDELYSFLVDLLFRKKITPAVESLNATSDYSSISHFARKTLSQIYYTGDQDFSSGMNILAQDNFENMVGSLKLLRETLLRASGLKWLKMEGSRESLSTFGLSDRI